MGRAKEKAVKKIVKSTGKAGLKSWNHVGTGKICDFEPRGFIWIYGSCGLSPNKSTCGLISPAKRRVFESTYG